MKHICAPPKLKRRKTMKTKGTPSKVDIHVGARLRTRRGVMGLSQEALANKVGLTFQQIQKYERGTNRISAGRLYELAQILEVPVSYFFDEIEEGEQQAPVIEKKKAKESETFERNVLKIARTVVSLSADEQKAVMAVASAFQTKEAA